MTITNRPETGGESAEQAVRAAEGMSRQTVSLDGEWRFRPEGSANWRTTQVPGCWEAQHADLRGWAGTAVYERAFAAPESYRGRRVLLRFGAVDYYTEAWVNGQFVGKHEGGYTPFSFDVQDALRWDGQENLVTVRVTDCTPEADVPLPDGSGVLSFAEIPHGKQSWYTPVSGIWQGVSLEARSFVAMERVFVRTDIDRAVADVIVVLTARAAESGGCHIRLAVESPEGAPGVPSLAIEVPAGHGEAHATLTMPDAWLWSPEHPNLYVLTATLLQGGEVTDEIRTRYGMRKIECREGRIWLNNEPYFLIGALDQAFYPRTIYTAPSEEYLRDQFRKAKEMGLNLMRCHIKVPASTYLDLCDEMGLLVWYEVPNGMLLSEGMRWRVRQLFVEMVARDGNHPCIVIKSIMNESWGIDLGDPEQRAWLIDTYHWAKAHAPDKLIVDNSACVPNFHVISDLDDYHVYFNIPDQAEEFREWIQSFAERNAGSYSGFGDADRRRNEPLLISEFGNWGLPHHDKVVEAEGGIPWWFETGAGITQPAGVLQRFEKQRLGRAFGSYNGLADASQEQEWLALKYQIQEMRRYPEVAGYVVTEFSDINWESNGLLDFGRNPKVFHNRLAPLQQQDALLPRTERHSWWSGEVVCVDVDLSRFGDHSTEGGRLEWRVLGIEGSMPVGETPRGVPARLGALIFQAPDVDLPTKTTVDITLYDRFGQELASTSHDIVVVPARMRHWGVGRDVWLHDPLNLAAHLADRLAECGFRLMAGPVPGALGIVTQWDGAAYHFVQTGGRAVLAALHPKSLTIASGLGLRLLERTLNNWWGDWCSSQTWFVPSAFPYLPDTQKFGFEYTPVVPKRVLHGATPENVLSGIFVGWLHNPAAYVVQLPVAAGKLVATTYDFATHYGSDPISTLMLACMADQLR